MPFQYYDYEDCHYVIIGFCETMKDDKDIIQ